MKIIDIQTTALRGSLDGFSENRYFFSEPRGRGFYYFAERAFMIVQVITDNGLIGLGTHCHSLPWKLFAAAVEDLKEVILGEDAFFIERIWEKMYQATYRYGRRGAVIGAMGAIDIALWDLLGKALETPLYKLLGGYRSSVPVYASGGYFREQEDIKHLVAEVERWVDLGYSVLKFKIGALGVRHDLERVAAVRKAVGPEIKLIADSVGGYLNVNAAIKMAQALEKYDIYWFEEPLQADNIDGLAELRHATDLQIASGEIEYTRYGFKELLEKRAVDIIMPDAAICGGITEFKRIVALAAAQDVPVVPHRSTEVHTHLLASLPNGLIVESFPLETQLWNVMFLDPPKAVNGQITLTDKPGLGIEFDWKAVEKYRLM